MRERNVEATARTATATAAQPVGLSTRSTLSQPAGARRSVMVRTSQGEGSEDALDRVVALLSRALERLLTGNGVEQDGEEVEPDLDFLPHQSVTTDAVLGSIGDSARDGAGHRWRAY